MYFATWNVSSLYRAAALRECIDELAKCKVDICAIQKIRWPNGGILKKKDGTL